MRIVITGASGNVGTALLLRLGGDRHELVGVSRRRPPDAAPYTWAQWHSVDIGSAPAVQQLTEAFDGADAVVHLAWRLQAQQRGRAEMARTNRDGTAAVVAAARAAGIGHLVHMSSIGAYSPGAGHPVDESWPTDGIRSSDYSLDKVAAERTVRDGASGLPVSVVRPSFILQDAAASEIHRYFLGPLVPRQVIRPVLIGRAPVPAQLAIQVVHTDDVADALARIVEQHAVGAFNVAADPVITRDRWREMFGHVGPDLSPAVLRRGADLTYRLRMHRTEPSWLDLAFQLPTLTCEPLRGLGWSALRPGPQVLTDFVAALGRGAGRPGPLLFRADHTRPGPAGESA